jgi:hypothetical protein
VRPDRRLVDVDDLVEMLDAFERGMRAGMLARIVELLRQRLVERLDDQRGLAEPDTPVTQVKAPSGMLAVTFWRLFSFAPFRVSQRPLPSAAARAVPWESGPGGRRDTAR